MQCKRRKTYVKKFRKSAVALLSVIVIESTMLPAQAFTESPEDPTAISINEEGIMPMAASISLRTTSYTTSIIVSWVRVPGASYYIATCGSQSQRLTAGTLNVSATFNGLTSGKSYSITVNAYDSSGYRVATGSTTATTR